MVNIVTLFQFFFICITLLIIRHYTSKIRIFQQSQNFYRFLFSLILYCTVRKVLDSRHHIFDFFYTSTILLSCCCHMLDCIVIALCICQQEPFISSLTYFYTSFYLFKSDFHFSVKLKDPTWSASLRDMLE